MHTFDVFGKPCNRLHIPGISKCDFKIRKRISIDSLYPNQQYLCDAELKTKLSGKRHTVPYVLCLEDKNILFDGHHTTAAKKIKGQKYIMALCYELKYCNEEGQS